MNSIRVFLFRSNIPYEIMIGNGYAYEIYRRNFKRTDNNKLIVELFTESKKVLNICINSRIFDNKNQAIKLKNIIWDEKSKSTEELSF